MRHTMSILKTPQPTKYPDYLEVLVHFRLDGRHLLGKVGAYFFERAVENKLKTFLSTYSTYSTIIKIKELKFIFPHHNAPQFSTKLRCVFSITPNFHLGFPHFHKTLFITSLKISKVEFVESVDALGYVPLF